MILLLFIFYCLVKVLSSSHPASFHLIQSWYFGLKRALRVCGFFYLSVWRLHFILLLFIPKIFPRKSELHDTLSG